MRLHTHSQVHTQATAKQEHAKPRSTLLAGRSFRVPKSPTIRHISLSPVPLSHLGHRTNTIPPPNTSPPHLLHVAEAITHPHKHFTLGIKWPFNYAPTQYNTCIHMCVQMMWGGGGGAIFLSNSLALSLFTDTTQPFRNETSHFRLGYQTIHHVHTHRHKGSVVSWSILLAKARQYG